MDNYEIYKISNDVNDKVYIGQTYKGIKNRFNDHIYSPSEIGKAIREIGKEHFKIEVLETADDYYKALELETKYINQFNAIENGYNNRLPCKGRIPIGSDFVYAEIRFKKSDYRKLESIAAKTGELVSDIVSNNISKIIEILSK